MPTPWQSGVTWATPQVDEGSITLTGYEGPAVTSPPSTCRGLALESTPPTVAKPAGVDTGTAEGGPGTTRDGGGLFPDLPAPYYYSGWGYGLCAILETWTSDSTYPARPSGLVLPVSNFMAEKHLFYPGLGSGSTVHPNDTTGWGYAGSNTAPSLNMFWVDICHASSYEITPGTPYANPGTNWDPYTSNASPVANIGHRPPSAYVSGFSNWSFGKGVDRSYVLEGGSLGDSGSTTHLYVAGELQDGDYYAMGNGIYAVGDDTAETWPDSSVEYAPGGWRIGATAWRDNFTGTAPAQTCQETAHARLTWLMYRFVYGPDGTIWPPPAGGDAYSLYGLSADTHPFGVTRMVYNVGFNSNALTLRRYYGQMGTPSDVALPFTGQSPHILCRDDGRHLVAASDGTNISVRLLDDEGTVLSTMPSPGSGKLVSVYQSRADAVSPVWAAFCTADTGTGDIKVYRTFDPAGLTGWEAAVTVASGMPAQKPTLTGDMARLLVSYHDGSGNVQTKYSTDNGATWTLSS